MPTIEIVSVNSKPLLLKQEDYKIAIREDKKPETHRWLFANFLKGQKGAMVHLGNPGLNDGDENGFWADQIVEWGYGSPFPITKVYEPLDEEKDDEEWARRENESVQYVFLDEYKPDVKKLLKIALDNSPIKTAYFLTDYQFGQNDIMIIKGFSFDTFWNRHDTEGLVFNVLYEITG